MTDYADADALAEVMAKWADPPEEMIGYLPRTTCRDCQASRTKVCERHQKTKCAKCGNYTTTAHIDIEFVGHADVTRILLAADPLWSWEPAGYNPDGSPVIIRDGNRLVMWAKLTVHGHTRLGVGIVGTDKDDPEKQLIGDFIRNAAMRYGVGLGLWSKSDRAADAIAQESPPGGPPASPEASPAPTGAEPANQDQVDEIKFISANVLDAVQRAAMREWADENGLDLKHLSYAQAEAVIDKARSLAIDPGARPEDQPQS